MGTWQAVGDLLSSMTRAEKARLLQLGIGASQAAGKQRSRLVALLSHIAC
jgi:hypothetical protein